MSERLVLITGGAGFIGSHVAATLAADRSIAVAVCDRFGEASLGKWRNLAKHPIADFVAPDQLDGWLAGRGRDVEAIVHMGAISSTTEPDAERIVATNFRLSRDIFDWCAREGRRFIYASSAATYGIGEHGFNDDCDVEALAALRPLNAYGWSKAQFDLYAVRRASAGAAPPQWAGLKFFNVYGPNEGHKGEMRSLVAKIWPTVAAGGAVNLFRSYRPEIADGGQQRDFIAAADAADVASWLFRTPEVSGIFNVGTGSARSFADLAGAVFAAAERPTQILYTEMPKALRGQYQYFTEARMERLRAAGYTKSFATLETGVADYVRGFLSADDPYR
ncbi:MAG TPA: ADP-glyceromanno-heptose 6-epimerase [Caulobacteraceae bacterium]